MRAVAQELKTIWGSAYGRDGTGTIQKEMERMIGERAEEIRAWGLGAWVARETAAVGDVLKGVQVKADLVDITWGDEPGR